jgi:hypothetical protein
MSWERRSSWGQNGEGGGPGLADGGRWAMGRSARVVQARLSACHSRAVKLQQNFAGGDAGYIAAPAGAFGADRMARRGQEWGESAAHLPGGWTPLCGRLLRATGDGGPCRWGQSAPWMPARQLGGGAQGIAWRASALTCAGMRRRHDRVCATSALCQRTLAAFQN